MNAIERVARALALSAGARISGPSQSVASREFGWKGDGKHLEQYVEAHWKEYEHAAGFAIEALRDPSQGARIAGHAALVKSEACTPDLGDKIGYAALGDAWRAMIDDMLHRS